MSGGDRGGHYSALAAVLTVAVLLAIATASAIGWQLGGQQHEPYPAYKEARDNQLGAQAPPRLNVQAQEYKHPCSDPQSRDESDLCAQYRAAAGANDAAAWAFYQLVLSALGLAGLIGTIYFTIRATNAAVEFNRIARDTAKRELRAYITVASAQFGDLVVNGKTPVLIMLKNTGQTPAYNLRTLSNTTLHYAGKVLTFSEPTFDDIGVGMMGANGETELNSESVALTMQHVMGLETGILSFYAMARVRYEDTFGDIHTLSITYESIRPVAQGKFRPCAYGNEEKTEPRKDA